MNNKEKPKMSEGSPKKDTRDAVESAISDAKGDRGITWEATIARTNKRISKWDAGTPVRHKKRAVA